MLQLWEYIAKGHDNTNEEKQLGNVVSFLIKIFVFVAELGTFGAIKTKMERCSDHWF